MIKRGKKYTAEFKTKVVLELLSEDSTLNQLSSKYSITPKSLKTWKVTFLANASLAFNVDGAIAEYKDEIKIKDKEVSELHRQLGKRTAELEWTSKKLKSLDYKVKKDLIRSKHDGIAIVTQCELAGFNRSNYYYQEIDNPKEKLVLLRAIDAIYADIPFFMVIERYIMS